MIPEFTCPQCQSSDFSSSFVPGEKTWCNSCKTRLLFPEESPPAHEQSLLKFAYPEEPTDGLSKTEKILGEIFTKARFFAYGRPWTTVLLIFFGWVLLIAVGPTAGHSPQNISYKPPVISKPLETDQRPQRQVEFVETRHQINLEYWGGRNEIIKSDVYNKARDYDSKFFEKESGQIKKWVGVIDQLSTSKGGDTLMLEVSIRMSRNSRMAFQESISKYDNVYQQARGLTVGQSISFSAKVKKDWSGQADDGNWSEGSYFKRPTLWTNFSNIHALIK